MKKGLICLIILLLWNLGAIAQESPVDKGSFLISGQASFSSMGGDFFEDYSGDAVSLMAINPSVAYFTVPGFFFGGDIVLLSLSQGDDDASLLGFGPTMGYYFNAKQERTEIKGAIYPYIKAFLQYHTISLDGADASNIMYGGKLGMNVMLTNSVALDAGVTYASLSFSPDGWDESISGSILSFGIGFTQFIW